MEDEAAVAEEGAGALDDGEVRVDVGLFVVDGDGAVLAAQVTDLARLGLGAIALGGLAADEGIEMGESLGAVAIFGDGVNVEVVCWRLLVATKNNN